MNILLVRFSAFGDLILTTPLIRAIRRRHPEARITFVTREDLADTLVGNPHLDELVRWKHGSSLLDLARQLRKTRWDHRLDLHGSLRSILLRRLVGGHWTTYPKERRRRWELIRSKGARGGALEPVAERYFGAARALEVTPDGAPAEFHPSGQDHANADALLSPFRGTGARPLIALAPGAAHFTKRWPPAHWHALVDQLLPDHDLVILGGPAERELGEALAAHGPRIVNAAGTGGIGTTAAILMRARAVAVGDTGVLHLATAVQTPVVGLYGPTVEAFGFFPYRARAEVLQQDLPCRPCSAHGGPACPLGHQHCMVQITPASVAKALREICHA